MATLSRRALPSCSNMPVSKGTAGLAALLAASASPSGITPDTDTISCGAMG
ncbi:hypothetical protein [Burkholderia ubonensis]|uniref:hypothetical protein n=1 Tax=Burkholderia ubonensis TaxID=101571 RepID=UPI001E586DD7|nr:hypothetical protein [Burkholderia ubonensis]